MARRPFGAVAAVERLHGVANGVEESYACAPEVLIRNPTGVHHVDPARTELPGAWEDLLGKVEKARCESVAACR